MIAVERLSEMDGPGALPIKMSTASTVPAATPARLQSYPDMPPSGARIGRRGPPPRAPTATARAPVRGASRVPVDATPAPDLSYADDVDMTAAIVMSTPASIADVDSASAGTSAAGAAHVADSSTDDSLETFGERLRVHRQRMQESMDAILASSLQFGDADDLPSDMFEDLT